MPHGRIAGGNAGEITEAAGGIVKNFLAVIPARQHLHQTVGQHVGQMAGRRQHCIVMSDVHFHHLRATGPPHGAGARDRIFRGLSSWRQNHPPPGKQFRKGSLYATFFCACNRMTGHKARR